MKKSFTEAKISLLKKSFLWRARLLAGLVWILAGVIYTCLWLRQDALKPLSQDDLADFNLLAIKYCFPWWTDMIFALLWLAIAIYLIWYFKEKRFYLIDRQNKLSQLRGQSNYQEMVKELEDDIWLVDAYYFSIGIGGLGLGVVATFYFGGLLYGLVTYVFFALYFHVFMMVCLLAWSFLAPLVRFFIKRK